MLEGGIREGDDLRFVFSIFIPDLLNVAISPVQASPNFAWKKFSINQM